MPKRPAADYDVRGFTSDPYLVATLTGYWSHGQEWPPDMRFSFRTKTKSQTLNPRWLDSAKFYVPRSGVSPFFAHQSISPRPLINQSINQSIES